MKKIFLFVVLLVLCNGAYAQNAGLKIQNRTQVCTAYVNVWAADATTSNGLACDIATCTIIVPPSTTYTWGSPVGVMTGFPVAAGFCGMTNSVTPTVLATALLSGTFIWTDASIQYSCQVAPPPNPPCTEGGCILKGNQCMAGPGECLLGGVTSWAASVCTGALNGADWLPNATCFMTDVTIDIY